MDKREFTRHEFYTLVWTKPPADLAAELGITEKQLARVCQNHLVPFPPKRFWEQRVAGAEGNKTPLRAVENPAIYTVKIGESFAQPSAYAAELFRQSLSSPLPTRPPKPAAPPRPAKPAKAVEPAAVPTRFAEAVTAIHPVAKHISAGLRTKPIGPKADVSYAGITLHPTTIDRLQIFLHHLFSDLGHVGVRVEMVDEKPRAILDEDSVTFEITEERKRHKYFPTKEEEEALERARERSRRRNFEDWPDPLPQYSYEHTGRLTFEISGWGKDLRRIWRDGRTQRLEGMLDDIVSGIGARIDFERQQRIENEERQKRRAVLARRRELAAGRAAREAKRLELVQTILSAQQEAKQIRGLLDEIPDTHTSGSYVRMIAWAQARLRLLEGKTDAQAIADTLDADDLFPESDPLFDPDGEPPPKRGYWDVD